MVSLHSRLRLIQSACDVNSDSTLSFRSFSSRFCTYVIILWMTGSSMGCKKHISSFVYVHVCGRTGLTVCIKQQTENIRFASTTKLEPRDSMFSVVLVYIWDTGMCYGKIIHCVVLILPFPLCPSKHGKLLQPTGSCVQG